MDVNLIKESTIEYCENIYALGINKSEEKIELKNMLAELIFFEDRLRECNDISQVNKYKTLITNLINRIEGVINE